MRTRKLLDQEYREWKNLLEKMENKEFRDTLVAQRVYRRLAQRIFALRQGRKMTQRECGELMGMTQGRIAQLESRAPNQFNVSTLLHLARGFDVGLVVDFAPFTEIARLVMTRRVAFNVRGFEEDYKEWLAVEGAGRHGEGS